MILLKERATWKIETGRIFDDILSDAKLLVFLRGAVGKLGYEGDLRGTLLDMVAVKGQKGDKYPPCYETWILRGMKGEKFLMVTVHEDGDISAFTGHEYVPIGNIFKNSLSSNGMKEFISKCEYARNWNTEKRWS